MPRPCKHAQKSTPLSFMTEAMCFYTTFTRELSLPLSTTETYFAALTFAALPVRPLM